MNRVRIKICGLTRQNDVHAAIAAGADAIGLVFSSRSKRNLSAAQAASLVAQIPAFVSVVGLFVDASAEFINTILARVALDQLQFHGAETPEFCRQFGKRYLKAIAMNSIQNNAEIAQITGKYPDASAFLFDAFAIGEIGGNGKTWQTTEDISLPLNNVATVIAGGLNAANVGAYIQKYHPFAVDVSSGVEDAPAIKSSAKMNAFVQAVERAKW